VRQLVLGVLVGVGLGLGTSLVFPLIAIGPGLGLWLGSSGLGDGPAGRSRVATGAGLLIGAGSVYLVGAVNTLMSCWGQEVCGGTSVLPFLGYAVLLLAIGVALEALGVSRRR